MRFRTRPGRRRRIEIVVAPALVEVERVAIGDAIRVSQMNASVPLADVFDAIGSDAEPLLTLFAHVQLEILTRMIELEMFMQRIV